MVAAALDQGQTNVNRPSVPIGCVKKLNLVTTPKLPPPPPRSAQKRSEWCAVVTGDRLTGGEHDVCGLDVVAGETELAPEHPEAAAEGEPGDPDARTGPPGHRHLVRGEPGVQIDQAGARPDTHKAGSTGS